MRNLVSLLNLCLISIFIGLVQCRSADLPNAADIYHWAVNVPQPSLLAKVAYDPDTLESKVLSYTPPTVENSDNDLRYRVGFYTTAADGSKQWVGSLVLQSALTTTSATQHNYLQLYLSGSQQHELYHVSLSKKYNADESSESIGVELVYPSAGALPELNKPIVVSPDGTGPQEVVEKTFFQKYWWVLMIVAVLTLSGGGGEGQ
ncbi:hypothetical protein TMatcc_007723 [Talaromyces marneffei ATCC 18224]|uniref:ER membrane protein complex subunit 10 n=2 Tax=Talaromyces marneffei TaxID=37727 RepID=B6QGN7_TALMQ|nr:uncharacterized protein EYB26_004657 [Talaromyces marneffei]EEA24622.1 conserved hypothetical protein [Talaromyces marneffei ATCC 18224]KAE8552880.1 hypothetical protein EYB25_004259 [Talaromyces marneffei]QGA16987.1 hypothetical protein EYB26_004657 [Talaromyces marneffei]